MTSDRDTPNRPTREDILIGRVTDGEASPNDWAEIEDISATDPGIWHRLAAAQRTHARIESAVEDAIAISELIDIPDLRRVRRPVAATVREYAGWSLAAGLAIALTITMARSGVSGSPASPSIAENPAAGGAMLIPNEDLRINDATGTSQFVGYEPEQGYDRYLQYGLREGFVLGQQAPVVLQTQHLPDGTYELIITRAHIERRKVTDLNTYRVQRDEWGNEHLVPSENGAQDIPVQQVF